MKINFKNLKNNSSPTLLIVDWIMLNLIIINLVWMTFDFSFETRLVQSFIHGISEDFFVFYNYNIHPDFLFYDSFFVALFLIEIVIRWVVSIIRKDYNNWIAYPFIHWYDVLGCIPVGGFRSLRLLRIISIVFRLHKKGIIDIRSTWWYKLINRYYNMLAEEVSDRVVVNIIKGTQKEIEAGAPITDEIIEQIIKPRQELIVEFISYRMKIASDHYFTYNSNKLKSYINNTIKESLSANEDIRKLELVPVVGKKITSALSSGISDITLNATEKVIKDLSSSESKSVINEFVELGLDVATTKDQDEKFMKASKQILIDCLNIIKAQVEIKQWKENK